MRETIYVDCEVCHRPISRNKAKDVIIAGCKVHVCPECDYIKLPGSESVVVE